MDRLKCVEPLAIKGVREGGSSAIDGLRWNRTDQQQREETNQDANWHDSISL